MDNGDGENLENLSTCFGIPRTEPFFNRNCPNLIFPTATKGPVFLRRVPVRPLRKLSLAARQTFPEHNVFKGLRFFLHAVLAHLAGCLFNTATAERRPATAPDCCCWTKGVGGASVKPTNQKEEMRRKHWLHPPSLMLLYFPMRFIGAFYSSFYYSYGCCLNNRKP